METSCDYLVIGSGVAGLSFAIHASKVGSVALITKKQRSDSNTNYAQGGIACVLDPNDSFESHIEDTVTVGCHLNNTSAVRSCIEEGPKRIRELLDWGVSFSRSEKEKNQYGFHLGKEGGHSANRIIHAKDLTGREVERALLNHLKNLSNVTVYEEHIAIDLITDHQVKGVPLGGSCYGAYAFSRKELKVYPVRAKVTVLATGGAGQVYLHTTNPPIATGDGVAMAYRAGALIENMEFIQFHPTTLYQPGNTSFLISEALRGYGAVLRDSKGIEFMRAIHQQHSLAPRDIVARAIDSQIKRSGDPCVYLDVTHKDPAKTKKFFPNIFKRCRELGVDITKELIPVVPAAHYVCGGISVDEFSQTHIENLFAVGETSSTGVHGANRLASNSLLEAVVFSRRAFEKSQEIIKRKWPVKLNEIPAWDTSGTAAPEEWILLSHNLNEVREIMWNYVGIVRSNARLNRARSRINLIHSEVENFYRKTTVSPDLIELRNVTLVAKLIVDSAIKRKESRGLHYTTDYPDQTPRWKRNTVLKHPASTK